MDIDLKTFASYNGYHVSEHEFLARTGFKVVKEFSLSCRDDDYTVAIGRIGEELYWYKSNWGDIDTDAFGKIE